MRQADGVAAASLLLLLLPCILAQQITSTISIPYCSTSPGLFTIYGSMTSAIPSNILSSNSQTPTAGLLSSSVSSVATPLASAYVDQYGGKYTVQFDTGLIGNTIPASRIDGLRKRQAIDMGTLDQTFEDCLESCTLTSACVAVAALDSTCQLFSSVRETVSLVGGKVAFNQERFLGFSNGTILPSSMATEASSAQGTASASAISSGGFRSSMPGLASMPGGSMTPLSQLPTSSIAQLPSTLAMETSTAGPLVSSFVPRDISPAGSSSEIMPSAALSTDTVIAILSSGAVLSATSEPLSTFSSAGDPTITLQMPSLLSTESSVSISLTSSTPIDQLVSTMTSDSEISYSSDSTTTSILSSSKSSDIATPVFPSMIVPESTSSSSILAIPTSASISSAASSSSASPSVASASSSRSRAASSSSSSPGPISASIFSPSPAVPSTTTRTTSSSSSPATPTSSRKPPTCPDDDGEDYIDANGFIYIITCDIGFNDETIQTTTVQNFVDCITTCDAFNELPKDDEEVMGCGGVNFNSLAQTDNCFLMPGAEIAEMAGIWSGQLSGSIAE
ncbi:hypothetical protein SMMN14_06743 [Sphaerulina musiva]